MSAVSRPRFLPELSLISKNANTNSIVKENLEITITDSRIYFAVDENTYTEANVSNPNIKHLYWYLDGTKVQQITKDKTTFPNTFAYRIYGRGIFKDGISFYKDPDSTTTYTTMYLDNTSDEFVLAYHRQGQVVPYEIMRFEWNNTYPNSWLDINSPIRIENRTSNPSITAEGTVYWNSNEKKLKVYDGNSWVDVGGGGGGGVGDTIDTGNLRTFINRSQSLPITGGGSWYTTPGSVFICDEGDADQSRGLNIFSRADIPNITIGRFTNTLYAPGSSPTSSSVGRIVFVGSENNYYSDFVRLSAVKQSATNNICYGSLEIGVRNNSGTYTTPYVFNSSGHFRCSTTTPPTGAPDANTSIIGGSTVWVGNRLRVEGQVGYVEAANRSDGNGTALKIHSASGKFCQVRFSIDSESNQRGSVEIDTTGQFALIGGWNSGDHIRVRVGSGLPDVMRIEADKVRIGQSVPVSLVLHMFGTLPTNPDPGTLCVHLDGGVLRLKFYNGTSWITIA